MKFPKDLFTFRISSMTPESLPMARLIEYLAELAKLFGNKEHVHFMKVVRGSAAPAILVDSAAAPKVHSRLRSASSANPSIELAKTIANLNTLLRDDNAFGDLHAPGGAKIIQFPGKKEVLDDEVVISEAGSIEGQLIRLGGKDETAHATIEVEPGRWENFALGRSLAKELARHLYGDDIRVFGKGKWRRSTQGGWILDSFTAERFENIGNSDLVQTMRQLCDLQENAWHELDDPLGELQRMRGGASE